MLFDILKGFLVGICASAPLGPTAIFIMQKSLSEGHRTGFFTGLGATVCDTFYAVVAIFALAFAESFIDSHTTVIAIGGGLVVGLMGVSMAFRDPFRKLTEDRAPSYSIRDFFKAVAMALSNPASVVVMFTLLAFFGIDTDAHGFRIAPVILALSAGSATYWFFFSMLFSKLRKKVNLGTLMWLNRILGIIVMIIGIAVLAAGVMKLLFP